jgi:thiol-disulfide isomerase/thioredoxin
MKEEGMPSRLTLIALLAVPVILGLLIVVWQARPAAAPPVGQQPAAQAPASLAQQPTAPSGPAAASTAQPRPSPAAQPTALPAGPRAPDFDGGGAWINSDPLTLADLTRQGKVVLVDFWTYGCYNCQNTLPYVKQWWEKYKDRGLVIVGVHTPEFASEQVLENVQAAVQREGIGWPVVQDNDYTIWRAYGNHYWPRFYLVDQRGKIIYDRIGEGAYAETERQIAAALEAAKTSGD